MSTKYLDKTGLEHIGEVVDTAKHKTYSITAENSNLSLEDTTAGYPLDIRLEGNLSQTEYSGKNLLNVKDGNYTYSTTHSWIVRNGIVDLTVDSMEVQGGSLALTNGITQQWSAGTDNNVTPSGGTYTVSINRIGTINCSTSNNPGLYLYLYIFKEGGTYRSVNVILDKTSTSATTTSIITLDNDEHIGEATLYSQFIECTNVKLKIQIEEGATATSYEPYVGKKISPNTDYPQPINVVSGRQEITISDDTDSQNYDINLGKNLFDKTNNIVNGAYISSTGTVMTNSPDLSYQDAYIKVTPNTIYTISSNENITYRIAQYDESKTFIHRYVSSDSTNYQFTTRFNCYYIKMAGVSTTAIDSIQIEKGSTATTYSSYFTPIELCKIGTYQDYIYKNNDKWYKKAYIGKVILNGSETIKYIDTKNSNHAFYIQVSNVKSFGTFNEDLCIYSDRLEWANMNSLYNETEGITPSNGNSYYYTSSIGLYADATKSMTVEQFKTWLSTNNITVYYILDTPTDTEITDTTLISQLESLKDATTFENTTHITVSSNDELAIVKATYNKAHFLNTLDKSELKDEIKALAENTSEILGDINTALESIVTVGGGS